MKKKLLLCLFLLATAFACNNSDKSATTQSENDVDAARNFIRSALDGKFDNARRYMLPDSSNVQYLAIAERSHQYAPPETTRGYRESSITIYGVNQLNDSTTIVIYSNTFKNNPDTLKVLRVKDKWLVDLKYLYEHDMDTSFRKANKDTLR